MRFRLTYEGELRATQRDPEKNQRNPLAEHKHMIRRAFHVQLKHLWATDKFLREAKIARIRPGGPLEEVHPESHAPLMAEVLADQYQELGYRFVPLVREEISLLCSLRILFLRRGIPGKVIYAGDIDNRIKTVIDALRRPRHANELVGHESPREGEDPFYVLLEDDSQVTHLEVETDTLLDPPTEENADQRYARLVITVEIHPYYVTMFNVSFS